MSEIKKQDNVAVRISMQTQVGDRRIISCETWVDQLMPKSAIDGLVDKLMKVADRQTKRYELEDLKNANRRWRIETEAMIIDLENADKKVNEPRIIEGRRLPAKPSQKELVDLANMKTNIQHRKTALKRKEKEAEEMEAALNEGDTT